MTELWFGHKRIIPDLHTYQLNHHQSNKSSKLQAGSAKIAIKDNKTSINHLNCSEQLSF